MNKSPFAVKGFCLTPRADPWFNLPMRLGNSFQRIRAAALAAGLLLPAKTNLVFAGAPRATSADCQPEIRDICAAFRDRWGLANCLVKIEPQASAKCRPYIDWLRDYLQKTGHLGTQKTEDNTGVSLAVLGNFTGAQESSSDTYTPLFGMGGALAWDIALSATTNLELGARLFKEGFGDSTAGITSSWLTLSFPVGFRFWPTSSLSLGAGLYYQQFLGNVKVTSAQTSTTGSFSAAGLEPFSYGIWGDVTIDFHLFSSVRNFIQFTGDVGMKNVVASPASQTGRLYDLQGAFGVRL
jgi:hypothetical protein